MLGVLISSKTRIKLLLKFFLNRNTTSYLRNLETEFGESTNAIRVELNRLEEAGMLESFLEGNKKMFKANQKHPLFEDIHKILLKYVGIDKIIEEVIERLGKVEKVYLIGDFSKGIDSQIIDLVLVGEVEKSYLIKLIDKAELLIQRKVRYMVYSLENEEKIEWGTEKPLLLWCKI